MPLIELQGVCKEYRLGETVVQALKGVDLKVERREFVAVWGPSGSGKSTLCNLIGMLDTPTSGVMLFSGRAVTELSDNTRSEIRNNSVGFVFQSFNLVPVLSALENVMLPLQIRGEETAVARQKAADGLNQLGLSEFATHRPQKLSGGQQQRVAIARALVTDPDLVIADEPTANLDSDTAQKIISQMLEINAKTGATFIFSTHDQRLLDRVHRRILLRDGTIAEDKTD